MSLETILERMTVALEKIAANGQPMALLPLRPPTAAAACTYSAPAPTPEPTPTPAAAPTALQPHAGPLRPK